MDFEWDDPVMQQCQDIYNCLEPHDRLFMNHYELAQQDASVPDANTWKRFITDRRVSEWINEELTIFTQAQQRKLIKDATTNNRSVGAGQMINALGKTLENNTAIKDGPVFIYTSVPLNVREQGLSNVRELARDIFLGEE